MVARARDGPNAMRRELRRDRVRLEAEEAGSLRVESLGPPVLRFSPRVIVCKHESIAKRSSCEIRGPLKPGLSRARWTECSVDHADAQGDLKVLRLLTSSPR